VSKETTTGRDGQADEAPGMGSFVTTQWSMVLSTGSASPRLAKQALEDLCRIYWYPLYIFVRKRGFNVSEAEDLTQSFFENLLEREGLKSADKRRGKFRCFLLASLNNFLNTEYRKGLAQKRGGKYSIFNWSEIPPQELYRHEPIDSTTPERLFERRWALVVLEQVMVRLRGEYEQSERGALFQELGPYLTNEPKTEFYAEAARRLRMSPGALKVALYRLRRRFGEYLRQQNAATVDKAEEIDEEIRYLFQAISE